MNTTPFSVSLPHVGDYGIDAIDIDTLPSPEETLVLDARAGLTPSEMVGRKLLAALGSAAASDYTAFRTAAAMRRGSWAMGSTAC